MPGPVASSQSGRALHESEKVNTKALKALIRAADLNESKTKKR